VFDGQSSGTKIKGNHPLARIIIPYVPFISIVYGHIVYIKFMYIFEVRVISL